MFCVVRLNPQPNVAQRETAPSGIVFLCVLTSAIAGVILIVCFKFCRVNREWAEREDLLKTEAA